MRLDYNSEEQQMLDTAGNLEQQAKALRQRANELRSQREQELPLSDRLVFAAHDRCICGAGFAYDPAGLVHSPDHGPHMHPNQWECSTILRYYGGELSDEEKARSTKDEHSGALPFAFYSLISENQPRAYGATTRTR